MTRLDSLDFPAFYERFVSRVAEARGSKGSALTFFEKIFLTHRHTFSDDSPSGRGALPRPESYVLIFPDRLDMQDATAQMALLQLLAARVPECRVPAAIHCDHLIVARRGADHDVSEARAQNAEVYEFLNSCGKKFGLDVWAHRAVRIVGV